MMAFVASFPTVGSLSLRGAPLRQQASCPARTVSMKLDPEAPPEGRIDRFYPAKGRHFAPTINMHNVEGFELVNSLGLDFVEAPLDLDAAAKLRASIEVPFLSEEAGFRFSELFCSEPTNSAAETAVERYFPAARRFEVPLIEFEGIDDDGKVRGLERECKFRVTSANAFVDSTLDDSPTEEAAAKEKELRLPSFVRMAYGEAIRNMAPLIEIEDDGEERSISVSSEVVRGGPDPALYDADKFDNCAPKIELKKELFDGDISAFLAVSCAEVQLQLNALPSA